MLNLPVPDDRRVWQQACAVRDDGRPVEVLCPAMRGHAPGRRIVDGVQVTYLRAVEGTGSIGLVIEGLWNTVICVAQLPRLIRRGVRTLQVCNPPDTLFPLLVVCRLLGVGTIYDQHDVVPAMATARGNLRWIRPLFELLERLTVRCADVVLTSSRTQQRRLEDRYGVTPVLVRSATVAEDATPVDTGTGCHLGYLGVIGSQEGLEDLLEAVVLARRAGVGSLRVSIAGDGPFLDEARAEAARLGLGDVVSFLGWLQGPRLEDFLTSIDAMVVTDPDSEYNHFCAMNKVIEAMSRGMPILMRPLEENRILTGGHPWIADDWSTRSLASVIERFAAASPEIRSSVGARMVERHARVSWSVHGPRYVEAVQGAARHQPSGHQRIP